MHELGNVQHVVQDIRMLKPPWNEMSNPKQETVQKTIADDDIAAAAIGSWRAQCIQPTFESLTSSVYSELGEYTKWLRSEIEAINSYDGFMLGVHDKIEEFIEHTEFGLKQVLDVEQNIVELHETLEVYKFTLTRIQAEAHKALRCQGNLGPNRVLNLLRDTIEELNASNLAKQQQAAGKHI